MSAGATRVLTSGGSRTALLGAGEIASLVDKAGSRVIVVAGGGIREENVADVVRRSGVREIHVRGTKLRHTTMSPTNEAIQLRKLLPDDEGAWEETDETRVRALVARASEAAG